MGADSACNCPPALGGKDQATPAVRPEWVELTAASGAGYALEVGGQQDTPNRWRVQGDHPGWVA